MATYSFPEYFKAEERLRRMLVEKYGKPSGEKSFFTGDKNAGDDFDKEHIRDGVYRWEYQGSMEVQYNKPWGMNPVTLTYVNLDEKAKLGNLVEEAEKAKANKDTVKHKSVF